MENDTNENIDSKIDETVEDTTPEVYETEENNDEVIDDTVADDSDNEDKLSILEKKVKELEAQKNHWKQKATKPAPVKSDTGLSQNDLYSLIKADVHEDDVSEVVEYATLKKIPVKEALKSSVVKAILQDKAETRKTAEVSNTGTTRKSPTKVDADTLVDKARKGDAPQTKEEMQKVFLRMKGLDK